MLDRIISMRVFVQAATHGSLSAAGRVMDMSPAMATKHMDALEARLGVKLLHRTTRKLTLTDAGTEFLESCRSILQELDEAEAEVSVQRTEAVGRLRMNLPHSFGTRFIAPLLPEFSRRYPGIDVEVGLSDAQHDLIREGWDLGIRIGYLARHGRPRRVADLAEHNCLGYTLSPLQGKGTWAFGRQGDIKVPVHGNLTANNGDALLAAAVGGQGIIYQPDFIVDRAIAKGELVSLELDQPLVELGGLYVMFPPDRRLPAKVRLMIDFLVEQFVGSPAG